MKPARLSGAPRVVGPGWTLDEHRKERFYRAHNVQSVIENVGGKVHPEDLDLLRKALAAQFGFHAFSDWIDAMEDSLDQDIESEVKDARVSLELALQALDAVLGDRHQKILRRSREQADRRYDKPGSDAMENPGRNERIRGFHGRLVRAGDRQPVKKTADEFSLSQRQIRRIVSPDRT